MQTMQARPHPEATLQEHISGIVQFVYDANVLADTIASILSPGVYNKGEVAVPQPCGLIPLANSVLSDLAELDAKLGTIHQLLAPPSPPAEGEGPPPLAHQVKAKYAGR